MGGPRLSKLIELPPMTLNRQRLQQLQLEAVQSKLQQKYDNMLQQSKHAVLTAEDRERLRRSLRLTQQHLMAVTQGVEQGRRVILWGLRAEEAAEGQEEQHEDIDEEEPGDSDKEHGISEGELENSEETCGDPEEDLECSEEDMEDWEGELGDPEDLTSSGEYYEDSEDELQDSSEQLETQAREDINTVEGVPTLHKYWRKELRDYWQMIIIADANQDFVDLQSRIENEPVDIGESLRILTDKYRTVEKDFSSHSEFLGALGEVMQRWLRAIGARVDKSRHSHLWRPQLPAKPEPAQWEPTPAVPYEWDPMQHVQWGEEAVDCGQGSPLEKQERRAMWIAFWHKNAIPPEQYTEYLKQLPVKKLPHGRPEQPKPYHGPSNMVVDRSPPAPHARRSLSRWSSSSSAQPQPSSSKPPPPVSMSPVAGPSEQPTP